MSPGIVILLLWSAFVVSWVAASVWSSAPQRMPDPSQTISYRLLILLGTIALSIPTRRTGEALQLWHIGLYGAWLCVVAIAIGIGFTWWARLHLGRLWSASITLKPEHKVIDTGPYEIVRHPMYTGAFVSIIATAIAKGSILSLVGMVMIIVGFWIKARKEERWLTAELNSEAYEVYRRRVPMLIPFMPATARGPA